MATTSEWQTKLLNSLVIHLNNLDEPESKLNIHKIVVPARRINEIDPCKRVITSDTTLRLSEYFGLPEKFWLNLQMRYNLEVEIDKLKDRLKREVKRLAKVS